MELEELIDTLYNSGMIENQELAVTLLSTPDVTMEQKKRLIDQFIADYNNGKVNFFDEEHKYLFQQWIQIYSSTVIDSIKNRVKKIE